MSKPVYFALEHGFIVTARGDGQIPLNSRVVCRVEEANDELLALLIHQSNELSGSKDNPKIKFRT